MGRLSGKKRMIMSREDNGNGYGRKTPVEEYHGAGGATMMLATGIRTNQTSGILNALAAPAICGHAIEERHGANRIRS